MVMLTSRGVSQVVGLTNGSMVVVLLERWQGRAEPSLLQVVEHHAPEICHRSVDNGCLHIVRIFDRLTL